MHKKVILASESPRRKELLAQIGLKYKSIAPKIKEHSSKKTHQTSIYNKNVS